MDSKEAISLLKKHSRDKESFQKVLAHSQAVRDVALELWEKASQRGYFLDKGLIISGSLLHDIGRFFFPPGKESIKHGIKGSEILRKEGLTKESKIAERHVGFGIKAFDVENQHLPLPKKDYMPLTNEEKIVCYADKLIEGERRIPFDKTLRRFADEVGVWVIKRGIFLHNEIMALCSPDAKIKVRKIEDILKFINTDAVIRQLNNTHLIEIIKGLGIKSCGIEIERTNPLFILMVFDKNGLITQLKFSNEDEGNNPDMQLKILESLVLKMYDKSEEYAANPRSIFEILDWVDIPEEQKARLLLSLIKGK
jgi:uncharacterized protein